MDYRPIHLTTADGYAVIEQADLFASAQDSLAEGEGERHETIYRTRDGRQFTVRESCAEIDALLRAASLRINPAMLTDFKELAQAYLDARNLRSIAADSEPRAIEIIDRWFPSLRPAEPRAEPGY